METLPSEKALTWRCRRGMRELDQLLLGYLKARYPGDDPARKAEFVRLLDMQDPEIFGFLVRGVTPPTAAQTELVRDILTTAETSPVRP